MHCELCRKPIDGLNREIAVCWPCQSVPTSNRLRAFLSRTADELLDVAGKSKRVNANSIAATKLGLPLGPTQAPTLNAAQVAWFERLERERNDLREVAETNGVDGAYYRTRRGRRTSLHLSLASIPTDESGAWDGFHVEKAGATGQPQGRPRSGAVDMALVLSRITPPPAYRVDDLRRVAGLMGPAVNGDRPIRDELDRICSEVRRLKANVGLFAEYVGLSRQHVYARAARYRRRFESMTEAA